MCFIKNNCVIITPFLDKKYFAIPSDNVIVSGIGEDNIRKAVNTAFKDGINEILFVGSCGVLDGIEIGSSILPLSATFRQANGMSIKTPCQELTNEINKEFKNRNINVFYEHVVTVDSIEEETEEFALWMKENSISCVEMEFFHLLDISEKLGMKSSGLFYVTDTLFASPYNKRKSKVEKEAIVSSRRNSAEVAMSVISKPEGSTVSTILGFRVNSNRENEIVRLAYEIGRRENCSIGHVLGSAALKLAVDVKGMNSVTKFTKTKEYLLKRRFPDCYDESDFIPYLNHPVSTRTNARIYNGPFVPERIFIDSISAESELASNVTKMFPSVPATIVDSMRSFRKMNPASTDDPGKRDIVITKQQWDFVKKCPCTQGVVCCGYSVINLGFGCPFDCTYCFLQNYSNQRGIVLDSNIEDFFPRIDAYLEKHSGRKIRIGTGEFTDSLALDHITGYSKALVSYFANKNVLFELKTKSSNIDNLIGLEHNGKSVVSWSVNPESIVQGEEHGTATLAERLKAAVACMHEGYRVGFHFDPVIHFEGWEKEYRDLINTVFDAVKSPEWISVGTLRFHRGLKECIERRFPLTGYIYGEMVLGEDKKVRYAKKLRQEMAAKIVSWIKARNSSTYVYLCMETQDVWKKTFSCQK